VQAVKDALARLGKVRPSPGLVVACLALLVALGGTSWAATNRLQSTSPKGWVIVSKASVMDSASSHSVTANCPSGKEVLGGGFRQNNSGLPAPIVVQYSGPLGSSREWDVYGYEDSPYGGNWQVIAWAICAKVHG